MARILFLCDTFPPKVGGSESMMRDIARVCAADSHDVTVMVPANDDSADLVHDAAEPYAIIRDRLWARLFRAGGSPSPWRSRAARAALIARVLFLALKAGRFDLVVVGHVLPLGTVALALRRLRGTPYLLVTHGEEITVYSRRPRMRAMLIRALRGAGAIRANTDAGAFEMAALAPDAARRIHVMPPPATAPRADAEATAALRRSLGPEGAMWIVTVARLVPRKGIDMTLRALTTLTADDDPPWRYAVVGDGPQRAELEALATELGIADRVVFAGAVPETGPWFHLADVFAMPNRDMPDGEKEGYGIVFLEAALAGRPVIAGKSGGAPAAVIDGETGLVVDGTDPAAVAAALRDLLSDPLKAARMGQAARTRARALCDPESNRRDLLAMLEATLPLDSHASIQWDEEAMGYFVRIYCNFPKSRKDLAKLTAIIVRGHVENLYVNHQLWRMSIERNDCHQDPEAKTHSDDFIYYEHCICIDLFRVRDSTAFIAMIAELLNGLWTHCDAVASCEFESLLPFNGGISRPKR